MFFWDAFIAHHAHSTTHFVERAKARSGTKGKTRANYCSAAWTDSDCWWNISDSQCSVQHDNPSLLTLCWSTEVVQCRYLAAREPEGLYKSLNVYPGYINYRYSFTTCTILTYWVRNLSKRKTWNKNKIKYRGIYKKESMYTQETMNFQSDFGRTIDAYSTMEIHNRLMQNVIYAILSTIPVQIPTVTNFIERLLAAFIFICW